jgi:hypothetical protein
MQRPFLITAASVVFCMIAAYLWILGATLLISPGTLSLMAGKRFMYGLELAGPYMILLFGTGYALIGWGLFRLHKWARWLAMIVVGVSIAPLVAQISLAERGVPILWYGFQIALRVAFGWYLAQAPGVLDAFNPKAEPRIRTHERG